MARREVGGGGHLAEPLRVVQAELKLLVAVLCDAEQRVGGQLDGGDGKRLRGCCWELPADGELVCEVLDLGLRLRVFVDMAVVRVRHGEDGRQSKGREYLHGFNGVAPRLHAIDTSTAFNFEYPMRAGIIHHR